MLWFTWNQLVRIIQSYPNELGWIPRVTWRGKQLFLLLVLRLKKLGKSKFYIIWIICIRINTYDQTEEILLMFLFLLTVFLRYTICWLYPRPFYNNKFWIAFNLCIVVLNRLKKFDTWYSNLEGLKRYCDAFRYANSFKLK